MISSKKKILLLISAFVLSFLMLGLTLKNNTYADEEPKEVNNINFNTIMQDDGDYILAEDIKTSGVINIKGNINLDLNGHSIKTDYTAIFKEVNLSTYVNLIISDSSESQTGSLITINENGYIVEDMDNKMTVTFNGGNYIAKGVVKDLPDSGDEQNPYDGIKAKHGKFNFDIGANPKFIADYYESTKITTEEGEIWSVGTQEYYITYILNGGVNNESNPASYNFESEDIILQDPSFEGNEFLGWFTTETFEEGSEITNIPKESNGDITLYAKYEIIEYHITYITSGTEIIPEGGNANPSIYTVNDEIIFNDYEKTGYTFTGLYLQEGEEENYTYTFKTSIEPGETGDIVLVDKYDAIIYNIDVNMNEGEFVDDGSIPETYTIEDEEIILPVVNKDHYRFMNWVVRPVVSDESSFVLDDEISSIPTGSYGDIELEAIFELETYNITVNKNGGEFLDGDSIPSEYNFESDEIILPQLEKEFYVFDKWVVTAVSDECSFALDEEISSIYTGSYGDITIEAQYIPEEYDITYHYPEEITGEIVNNNLTKYSYGDSFEFEEAISSGWKFLKWYKDEEHTEEITGIDADTNGNLDIYSDWKIGEYDVIIKFYMEDEEDTYKDDYVETVEFGSPFTYNLLNKASGISTEEESDLINGYVPSAWKFEIESMPAENVVFEVRQRPIVKGFAYQDGKLLVYVEGYKDPISLDINGVKGVSMDGNAITFEFADGTTTVLSDIATMDDLKDFLTAEDIKDFLSSEDIDKKIAALEETINGKISTINTTLDALKNKDENLKTLIDNAVNDIASNTSSIDALKTRLTTLEGKVSNIEATIENINSKLTTIDGTDTEQNTKIQKNINDILANANNIDELKTSLNTVKSLVDDLTTRVTDLENSVKKTNSNVLLVSIIYGVLSAGLIICVIIIFVNKKKVQ